MGKYDRIQSTNSVCLAFGVRVMISMEAVVWVVFWERKNGTYCESKKRKVKLSL
jgi:hypothetical protein